MVNGYSLNHKLIENIAIAYNGDLGKGQFKYCMKVGIKHAGNWMSEVVGIGDVKCKKDSGHCWVPSIKKGIDLIFTATLAVTCPQHSFSEPKNSS